MSHFGWLIRKLPRKAMLGCCAAAIAMGAVDAAHAIKVEYTVHQNSFGTFLHDAERTDRRGYWTIGSDRARYNGTFTGDLENRVLTNITGEFTGTLGNMRMELSPGSSMDDTFTLHFYDGAIHGGLNTDGTVGGNRAGGYINYGIMVEDNLVDSGTMYFYPQRFTSISGPDPNYLAHEDNLGPSNHDFALWGNNWINRESSQTSLTTWNNIWQSLGFGTDQNGEQIVPGTGIEISKYPWGERVPPDGFVWLGTDMIGWGEEIPGPGPGPGGGQTTPPAGTPEPVTATMGIMAMGAISTMLRRRR